MSDDTRPDPIEGLSTDEHPTPGDPELRTANAAPDATERHGNDDERAGVQDRTGDLADDVHDVRGDGTPGTKLNPA